MAKQKGALLASITAIAILIAVIFGGCGQQPEDVPVDSSISSETEETKVDESVETPAEPEKESEKEEAEVSASTEEEVVSTSDNYLTEMSQGDCFEFKYSDYNSEYEVGNRITLTVEMESNGTFNGCVGSCVGSSYEWQQEEFGFESGRHTATWTVTPSLDECQLNLWYADSAPVGVVSINVTIEEVEPAVIGKIATFTKQDTFEFTFSEYNSEYKVGDLVKISVVMESDGDFNGSIGASVGRDYTWNQKEFSYNEGGKYTLTWTVKPSSDYSNIGIWWVGGTSVGIHSITVTVLEEEIGIHGDYLTMFTDEANFEFIPSLVNPSFKFGDKIRITVTFESDGEFTGSLGTCIGSNYEWTQTEYESDAGISTWVLDISPVIDSVQLGVWYIGGTAVGILDIDVEILSWGYQHNEVKGLIYTSTQKNDTYPFMPSDYCDFEDGDIITIRVELDSNDVYNGCVGVNDINGTYRSANYSSNGGTVFCELVVEASTKEEAKIEFWWMNTKVALNSITVTKGGTIVDTNDDDIYHPGEVTKFRTASDYCDYKAGDTITVTVTLSGDGYFNGAVGMAGIDWIQKDFESADGSPVTCTITVPNAVSQLRDIQIGIWWSEGSYVKIESITVTKDSSDDNEDDDQPDSNEQIDTSSWQLAFNGFTKEWGGWNSVNGDTGELEFQATVQDIMTANSIADISEFGGFLFQIWHVDSKYDGRTYTYSLDINGNAYKEGEGTIKCNEYNSTDVIQITTDDYAFTPQDVIHGVITVSAAEEPDESFEEFDTSNWQLAFNGFTKEWGGWNSVSGDTGKLEFQATVQDIMTANDIADISEFGGFLFQIWHVDSKYDGRTYTYSLDINGNTYKEGEGTIKCNEYNSTDVIQITTDDYAFTPQDVIHGVITVSAAEEPDESFEEFDTSNWQLAFNGFTKEWGGWNSVSGDTGKLEFQVTVQDIMTANNIADISEFGGFLFQIWHVDSKYDGRTYAYRLEINGINYREEEGTIKTDEHNSTNVIQITTDDYALAPQDVIHGVVIVSAEEEPDESEEPTNTVTIFEGNGANESYESNDASWLINADDNDMITIVYTCDDPDCAGWGVLSWGATVDDEWTEGDGYSADSANASKEMTIRITAGQLRASLGITANCNVTYIKLGAWNGGRIISLTISESGNTEEPDDPNADIPVATLSLKNKESYSFTLSEYIPDLMVGDQVEIVIKLTTNSSREWNGGLGAACENVEYNWKNAGFDSNSLAATLEVTLPAESEDTPNTGAQIQLWWVYDNDGEEPVDENEYVNVYIVSVTRTGTASTAALDDSLQLLAVSLDESTTNSLTKSNAISANGEGTKNTAPDSTNDKDGTPTVSGNDAGEAESDSSDTISGDDTVDTENEDTVDTENEDTVDTENEDTVNTENEDTVDTENEESVSDNE